MSKEASDPPFPRMLPIVLSDGSPVGDFRSTQSWIALKDGNQDVERTDAEPITAASFLSEPHHRDYGRPWVLGRYYFDQLLDFGVLPHERVLDVGCGSGRLGIWLIPYLEADRYFGVDNHLRSLVAFAGYESFLHDLWSKRPCLMWANGFDVSGFGVEFEVLLDLWVSAHLPEAGQRAAFAKLAQAARTGARLFMPHAPGLGADTMAELGFALREVRSVRYPLLEGSAKPGHASDDWHVFVRR